MSQHESLAAMLTDYLRFAARVEHFLFQPVKVEGEVRNALQEILLDTSLRSSLPAVAQACAQHDKKGNALPQEVPLHIALLALSRGEEGAIASTYHGRRENALARAIGHAYLIAARPETASVSRIGLDRSIKDYLNVEESQTSQTGEAAKTPNEHAQTLSFVAELYAKSRQSDLISGDPLDYGMHHLQKLATHSVAFVAMTDAAARREAEALLSEQQSLRKWLLATDAESPDAEPRMIKELKALQPQASQILAEACLTQASSHGHER